MTLQIQCETISWVSKPEVSGWSLHCIAVTFAQVGFSDRCGLKFSSFMKSVTAAELFAPLYQEEVIRNTTLNKAISRDTARVTGF